MKPDRREALAENVVAAAIVGILCLVVAIVALAAETRVEAGERAAISAATRRPVAATPFRVRERGFSRIYLVEGKGPRLFGAVLALDSNAGSARVVAVLDAQGGLESARALSATSPRLPYARDGWLSEAADGDRREDGAAAALERIDPAEAVRRARAAEALGRLSAAVAALGGKAR